MKLLRTKATIALALFLCVFSLIGLFHTQPAYAQEEEEKSEVDKCVESGGYPDPNIRVSEMKNNWKAEYCLHKDVEAGGSEEASDGVDQIETPVCVVAGSGWVICPAMQFLSKLADGLYGIIEYFLSYETLTKPESRASIQKVWSTFRNIANVLFIIIFMFIVMSQISSLGISNYGIKRMLPRLIILSIIVNISFPLAIIAVDISNVLGASLKLALERSLVQDGIGPNSFNELTASLLAGSFAVASGLLSSVAVGGLIVKGAFYGLLAALVPTVIMSVISLAATLIILVARHAFVTVLVAVAPLAIALQLLPNTQSVYRKWKAFFTSMLLLYPMISLIVGVSKLLAYLIYTANQNSTLMQIMAVGIQAIPLFIIPLTLKSSLGMAGFSRFMSSKLQGVQKYAGSRAQTFVNRKRTEAAATVQNRHINSKFLPKKTDSRTKRLAKRLAANVVGGSIYRRNQSAKKDEFAKTALTYAERGFHSTAITSDPSYTKSLFGKGNHNIKSMAIGRSLRQQNKAENDLIKAHVVILQDYDTDDIKQMTKDLSLPETQKVAVLSELANRGVFRGENGAISYAQTLVDQNSRGPFSRTIATGVTSFLKTNAPGLVSGRTLEAIITPHTLPTSYEVAPPASGGVAQQIASTTSSPSITTQQQATSTSTQAQALTADENITQSTTEGAKNTDSSVDTATVDAASHDDKGDEDKKKVDLKKAMQEAMENNEVSPADLEKMNPEILQYAIDIGTEEGLANLRDSAKIMISSSDALADAPNLNAITSLANSGPAKDDGRYKKWQQQTKNQQKK